VWAARRSPFYETVLGHSSETSWQTGRRGRPQAIAPRALRLSSSLFGAVTDCPGRSSAALGADTTRRWVATRPDAAWANLRRSPEPRCALAAYLGAPPQTNEVARTRRWSRIPQRLARERSPAAASPSRSAPGGLHSLPIAITLRCRATLAFGDPPRQYNFRRPVGRPPPFDATCTVAVRAGCDVDPRGPDHERASHAHLLRLADQKSRLADLGGALEVAGAVPRRTSRGPRPEWLGQNSPTMTGVATACSISIVGSTLGR